MSALIHPLPAELIARILAFGPRRKGGGIEPAFLLSCALISRAWTPHAQAELVRQIEIGENETAALLFASRLLDRFRTFSVTISNITTAGRLEHSERPQGGYRDGYLTPDLARMILSPLKGLKELYFQNCTLRPFELLYLPALHQLEILKISECVYDNYPSTDANRQVVASPPTPFCLPQTVFWGFSEERDYDDHDDLAAPAHRKFLEVVAHSGSLHRLVITISECTSELLMQLAPCLTVLVLSEASEEGVWRSEERTQLGYEACRSSIERFTNLDTLSLILDSPAYILETSPLTQLDRLCVCSNHESPRARLDPVPRELLGFLYEQFSTSTLTESTHVSLITWHSESQLQEFVEACQAFSSNVDAETNEGYMQRYGL